MERDELGVVRLEQWGSNEHPFELNHPYLEIVYGPLLGPAAVVLARSLGRRLREEPDGDVDLRLVAQELGLRSQMTREPVGARSTLWRALDRLEHLQVIRLDGSTLRVRQSVPPLALRVLPRLPPRARAAHHQYMKDAGAGPTDGP